jgi:hypothetical protein
MTNLSLYDLDPGIGQVSLYITLHTLVSTMIVWYLKSKLVCRIVVSLLYRCTVSMLTSCDEKAKYDLRSSERKLKGLAAALTSCSSSKDLQLVSTNLRPKVFFLYFQLKGVTTSSSQNVSKQSKYPGKRHMLQNLLLIGKGISGFQGLPRVPAATRARPACLSRPRSENH